MELKGSNINVDEAIKFANYDNLLLKRRDNNMLLSDFQVTILKKTGFNYQNYSSVRNLLFDIEDYLAETFDEELDLVSSQLAELIYYTDTKK